MTDTTSQNKKPYITTQEVRKNFIKSFLLLAILVVVILLLSLAIGVYAYGDLQAGLAFGGMVALIVVPMQLFTARAAILRMTRGVQADPQNPQHARVISLVEGVSISAGLKRVPDVYIVPSDVPNAFASGMSEKDALVGVTQGLMDTLDRSELEGVIAHEMAHIVHRDVLLSSVAISLVSIILILSTSLSRMAFWNSRRTARSNSRNGNDNSALVLLVVMLLAILLRPLAMILGNIIQLAISRKREYAADAYAVRLCGYSEGLASALEKIGGIKSYSREQQASLGGDSVKCLYINFPKGGGDSLFSTHPSIERRIEILRNMY